MYYGYPYYYVQHVPMSPVPTYPYPSPYDQAQVQYVQLTGRPTVQQIMQTIRAQNNNLLHN